MKRVITLVISIIVIAGLVLSLAGCGPDSNEASATETQAATVQRGDLTVEITAAGNLALSRTEDLAFDLFYQEGTVAEVMVEEGDIVAEGQVLASLDTGEWDDELELLQDKLTQAERALTAKKQALVQAERKVVTLERAIADKEIAVAKAEREVAAEELAVSQAQLDLETAEYNLGEIDEVKEAQDTVDEAEDNLRLIKMVQKGELGGGLQGDFTYWNELKVRAEEDLADAQAELQDLLNDLSTRVSTDVALDVTAKQLLVKQKQLALEDARLDVEEAGKAVADARFNLENAKLDVEDASHDVDEAQLDVKDAEKALENAQEKLEEANSKSPLIVAPFDGFITKVNVEGGDDVMTGTVAVQLADPNKFEAEIMVSEMDIMQIKEGGEARVQVDALSGLTLPAEVTHISPTSTISQGVVNYKVKVEVASLEEMMQERQAAWQQAAQGTESGGLPDRMKEAIAAGRMTQEQAEEILKQRQEMPASIQATAAMSGDLQLKEGLTVTVTIVVDQRTDVLLVPNGAITRRGMETYVQVIKDGASEERAIQTGISDWQYTEVTDELSEGEQVLVPQGTAAVSATGEPRRPQGAMFFGPPPRG